MSLSSVLDLASRAMQVVQSGIRNTSHNISNVNTPGYSRQRQVLEPASSLPTFAGQIGTGVEQRTIERVTDSFVQRELVEQYSTQGSVDARTNVVSSIEELLNESQGEGLGATLDSFYDSFDDLATATTPGAAIERESVRSQGGILIETIQRIDHDLRGIMRAADRDIVSLLPEINSITDRIQTLNIEIRRQEVLAPANDLRDEREQLMRDLSQLVDVNYFEDSGGGLIVMLRNGLPLVEGTTVRSLTTTSDTTNAFSPNFSRVLWTDGSTTSDVTTTISEGKLGGLLESRDSIIANAVRDLDVIAYNVTSSVNAVHAAGVGLGGTVGGFFATLAQVEDSARDIALHANVVASTNAIAAGLTTDQLDNRNALNLAGLRTAQSALYVVGDPPGPASGPSRSIIEHAAFVVADVGTQSRQLQRARDTQLRVVENLENRRAEVSGVSVDEEVTSLIRLQAAFQANARVITTVDRLLEQVVNLIR